MISYSESFKIKWTYENWSREKEKGNDVPYLALRQNYNINRKHSKRRSVSAIVEIKTIPGGHLFIIILQFIDKSFLFYWAEWLSNIIHKLYKLFQKYIWES
jgi:hypothetical protein